MTTQERRGALSNLAGFSPLGIAGLQHCLSAGIRGLGETRWQSAGLSVINDSLALSIKNLVSVFVDQYAVTARISFEGSISIRRSAKRAAGNCPDHRSSDRITSYGFPGQATEGRTPHRSSDDSIGSTGGTARASSASCGRECSNYTDDEQADLHGILLRSTLGA
jgi:hypothetical protein